MHAFSDMVNSLTVRPSNKIRSICAPLRNSFGITHFWFARTTSSGGYASLASNPEMHEYFHSMNFHAHSPFFRNPRLIKPGFYSYNSISNNHFQNAITLCASKCDVSLGVAFVHKHQDELWRFGYATPIEHSQQLKEVVFQNWHLFKQFNLHFLKEAESIIKTMDNHLVDLPQLLSTSYDVLPAGVKNPLSVEAKMTFLNQIGILKQSDVNNLSHREKECLYLLKNGYCALEIGAMLGISNRTVEKYIETIKNKLSCFSKGELIRQANLIDMTGYFD